MKKLMLLVILATLASCGGKTGPVGTPGATGPAGTDGAQGPKGEPGVGTIPFSKYIEVRTWTDENGNIGQIYTYDHQGVSTSSTEDGLPSAIVNSDLRIVTEYNSQVNQNRFFLVDVSGFTQTNFTLNDVLSYIYSSPELTRSNNYYFTDGTNFYLSEDKESSKDLESMGSKIETAEVESVKEGLLSFGLSVERTEKLSKLLNSYRKISNKRALSASEKDVFTKELLGMTFDQAAKKMVENYDGLIETAADKNGTSPEAVKELVNSFLTR